MEKGKRCALLYYIPDRRRKGSLPLPSENQEEHEEGSHSRGSSSHEKPTITFTRTLAGKRPQAAGRCSADLDAASVRSNLCPTRPVKNQLDRDTRLHQLLAKPIARLLTTRVSIKGRRYPFRLERKTQWSGRAVPTNATIAAGEKPAASNVRRSKAPSTNRRVSVPCSLVVPNQPAGLVLIQRFGLPRRSRSALSVVSSIPDCHRQSDRPI